MPRRVIGRHGPWAAIVVSMTLGDFPDPLGLGFLILIWGAPFGLINFFAWDFPKQRVVNLSASSVTKGFWETGWEGTKTSFEP